MKNIKYLVLVLAILALTACAGNPDADGVFEIPGNYV